MKAILVIDMPTDCVKCPLADGYCWNTFPTNGKADGCPLKPLPNKKPVSYHDDLYGEVEKNFTNIGWNACLEELEKC